MRSFWQSHVLRAVLLVALAAGVASDGSAQNSEPSGDVPRVVVLATGGTIASTSAGSDRTK